MKKRIISNVANKKVFILFALLFFFTIFICIYSVSVFGQLEDGKDGKETSKITSEIYSRTANTDTYKNSDGTYTKIIYSSAVNRDSKTRRFPLFVNFENTIDVTETKSGELKIYDKITEDECYISMNYEKMDSKSTIQPKIDIYKNRGNWYFETDAKTPVSSMNYKINCSDKYELIGGEKIKNYSIKFEEDSLKLGENLKIDFKQAKELQNISTTYDEKTKLLSFSAVAGKTADLSKIDPIVSYQYNTTYENINLWAYDSNSIEDNAPPPDSNPPTGFTVTDQTLSATLDADDSSYLQTTLSSNKEVFQLFKSMTPENSLVTLINWSWNGRHAGGDNLTFYLWNSTQWITCALPVTSGTETWRYCSNSSNQFVTSNLTSLLVYGSDDSVGSGLYTDYVQLQINYIPTINIISPTPSQIFTQDSPTALLNISINNPVNICYWNNGSTNFTMASINSTYFYNSTAGSQLLDGSKTISFWCNDSTTGEWAHSSSVSFDVDSVNVTTCRDLTVGNRSYKLISNISAVLPTSGTCIDITATNVTFEMNNNNITDTTGSDTRGISAHINSKIQNGIVVSFDVPIYGNSVTDDYATIENMTSLNGDYYGLYSFGDYWNLTNVIIINSWNDGIISFGNNWILNNVSIINAGEEGISISGNNLIANNLNITGAGRYGILSSSATNVVVRDSKISGSVTRDVYIITSTSTFTFINTTYSTETVTSGNTLTRKWYFSAQANYTHNGTAVNGANITASNNLGVVQNSQLTSSGGNTSRWELIEYINNGGTKTYYTNYTFTAIKTGWDTNTQSINLTTNYLKRQFNISDQTAPSLSITHPLNGESFTVGTAILNYTISDSGIGLSSCWYKNNSGPNITITCGTNTTISQGIDGTYTIYMWANDSLNNIASTSHLWTISSNAPATNLNQPEDSAWINNNSNIYFNFTATDLDGVNTCQLWGNWTDIWHKNYTWINPNSGIMNFTTLYISDGYYQWNIKCNDTTGLPGTSSWGTLNKTFGIDSIYPLVYINSITTTAGSQTISFSHTESDLNLNSTSCKYSIYDDLGAIDGVNNNISISCNQASQNAVVSAYATYQLYVCGKDLASNEKCTNSSFTTSASSGGTLTIGGGGSPPTEDKIPVIGILNIPNATRQYNDLERMILYAFINNYVAEQVSKETLATADYSDVASLSQTDMGIIINRLQNASLIINTTDFIAFYHNYQDKILFQGYATQGEIDKYGLFVSVLGLTSLFKINPPSVDKFVFFYNTEMNNITIPLLLTANKELKSCDLILNSSELNCNVNNFTISLNANIIDSYFLSDIYSYTILLTSEGDSDKIEQKRVNITLRIVNLGYRNILIYSILILTLLIILYIYFRRKRRIKIKEVFKLS